MYFNVTYSGFQGNRKASGHGITESKTILSALQDAVQKTQKLDITVNKLKIGEAKSPTA